MNRKRLQNDKKTELIFKKKLNIKSLLPMKRFVINTIFLLLLVLIIALTIFGKRGFLHMMRLQEELHEIEYNNSRLKLENDNLKLEITNLKDNLRYLEELSRNELGLAREGELIYRPEKKQ